MEFDYEILEKKFKELPAELQYALTSIEVAKSVEAVAQKNGLLLDQMDILFNLVSYVILGLLPSNDFTRTLAKEINVNEKQARMVVDDINNEVFAKIRESMREYEKNSLGQTNQGRSSMSPPQTTYSTPKQTIATQRPIIQNNVITKPPASVNHVEITQKVPTPTKVEQKTETPHADLEKAGNFKIEVESEQHQIGLANTSPAVESGTNQSTSKTREMSNKFDPHKFYNFLGQEAEASQEPVQSNNSQEDHKHDEERRIEFDLKIEPKINSVKASPKKPSKEQATPKKNEVEIAKKDISLLEKKEESNREDGNISSPINTETEPKDEVNQQNQGQANPMVGDKQLEIDQPPKITDQERAIPEINPVTNTPQEIKEAVTISNTEQPSTSTNKPVEVKDETTQPEPDESNNANVQPMVNQEEMIGALPKDKPIQTEEKNTGIHENIQKDNGEMIVITKREDMENILERKDEESTKTRIDTILTEPKNIEENKEPLTSETKINSGTYIPETLERETIQENTEVPTEKQSLSDPVQSKEDKTKTIEKETEFVVPDFAPQPEPEPEPVSNNIELPTDKTDISQTSAPQEVIADREYPNQNVNPQPNYIETNKTKPQVQQTLRTKNFDPYREPLE